MNAERSSKLSIVGAILMAASWILIPLAQAEYAKERGFGKLGALVVYSAGGALIATVGVGLAIAGFRSGRRTLVSWAILVGAILMLVPIGIVAHFCYTALAS